jgi:multisubunit Na+/H+ antiporter MnhE subunit
MILLTHIIIALSSVIYTTWLLFRPSQAKLYVSYALVGATLASGIYLTVVNPASMLRTCTTGITYIVIVTAGIAVARRKLATMQMTNFEKPQL